MSFVCVGSRLQKYWTVGDDKVTITCSVSWVKGEREREREWASSNVCGIFYNYYSNYSPHSGTWCNKFKFGLSFSFIVSLSLSASEVSSPALLLLFTFIHSHVDWEHFTKWLVSLPSLVMELECCIYCCPSLVWLVNSHHKSVFCFIIHMLDFI